MQIWYKTKDKTQTIVSKFNTYMVNRILNNKKGEKKKEKVQYNYNDSVCQIGRRSK